MHGCGEAERPSASPSTTTALSAFDTIFNSLEPIPPERVEVIISCLHQRVTAPVIDAKLIEGTWAQLCEPTSAETLHVGGNSSCATPAPRLTAELPDVLTVPGSQRSESEPVPLVHGHETVTAAATATAARQNLPPGAAVLAIKQTRGEYVAGVRLSSSNSSLSTGHSSEGSDGVPLRGPVNECAGTQPSSKTPATQPRPVLFNGLKFRLHDVEISEVSPVVGCTLSTSPGVTRAPRRSFAAGPQPTATSTPRTANGTPGQSVLGPQVPLTENECVTMQRAGAQEEEGELGIGSPGGAGAHAPRVSVDPLPVSTTLLPLRDNDDHRDEGSAVAVTATASTAETLATVPSRSTASPGTTNIVVPPLDGNNSAAPVALAVNAGEAIVASSPQTVITPTPTFSGPLASTEQSRTAYFDKTSAEGKPCIGPTDIEFGLCSTTAPAPPRNVLQCRLKLGITDYKTSIGTTMHFSQYAECVARRDMGACTVTMPVGGSPALLPCESTSMTQQVAAGGGEQTAEGMPLPRSLSVSLCAEEAMNHDAIPVRRTERYLANALGVEAMVITRDRQAVLFRRSEQVSEYPGYYCCPGGHPEPSHILDVKSFTSAHGRPSPYVSEISQDISMFPSEACKWFQYVKSDVIVEELFRSIRIEVADELGLPTRACHNRGLISIIRNAHTRKPDMCFLVDVEQTGEALAEAFNERNGEDAFESVKGSLVLMDLDLVRTSEELLAFVEGRLGGLITPPSLAALLHGVQCLEGELRDGDS